MDITLEEELAKEELYSDCIEKSEKEKEFTPNLTPEQELVRRVSGILRYMRSTYQPPLIIRKRGYDREDGTLYVNISDETFINTQVTVKVKQNLDLVYQSKGFYTKSELRVLDEFLFCWNKVVM